MLYLSGLTAKYYVVLMIWLTLYTLNTPNIVFSGLLLLLVLTTTIYRQYSVVSTAPSRLHLIFILQGIKRIYVYLQHRSLVLIKNERMLVPTQAILSGWVPIYKRSSYVSSKRLLSDNIVYPKKK